MRLANGFQIRLDMPQVSQSAFQIIDCLVGVHLDAGLVGLGVLPLQKPQLVLLEVAAGLERIKTQRHFSLLFQPLQVSVKFPQDIFHAGQVLARVSQSVGRFAAAFLVLGHPCGLFQKQAQLFGFGLDDAADGALTNDGVSAWTQAGAQKHVLHVAAAHRLVVDVVARCAVACQHAFHGDFQKLAPLAARTVVSVVKHQLHAGAAGWLARGGAVENHVLHGFAAQLGRLAFAQHPAHRVHDVGLAATVGPDHADKLPRQHKIGGVCKRLEAGQFDGVEAHASVGRGWRVRLSGSENAWAAQNEWRGWRAMMLPEGLQQPQALVSLKIPSRPCKTRFSAQKRIKQACRQGDYCLCSY